MQGPTLGVRFTEVSILQRCPLRESRLYPLFTNFFLVSVIQALVALIHDPEPEHPLRGDLAEEYIKDRKKFNKTAEEFTKKYAEKRPAD